MATSLISDTGVRLGDFLMTMTAIVKRKEKPASSPCTALTEALRPAPFLYFKTRHRWDSLDGCVPSPSPGHLDGFHFSLSVLMTSPKHRQWCKPLNRQRFWKCSCWGRGWHSWHNWCGLGDSQFNRSRSVRSIIQGHFGLNRRFIQFSPVDMDRPKKSIPWPFPRVSLGFLQVVGCWRFNNGTHRFQIGGGKQQQQQQQIESIRTNNHPMLNHTNEPCFQWRPFVT